MSRPLLFALGAVVALAANVAAIGCTSSSQVPLGQQGGPCDFDEQCDPAQGLSCQCVVRKNPDDEGPDQIVYHGFCDKNGVKCPSRDGGVDARADATDTGVAADTGIDAKDAAAADATSDAADAADAADVSDATATDADAAASG
jgi:hypothetical protein